tara:strand:- start:229 stop:633 length:405 start_codon:yes stop_codon:yes gene_type:complete
MKLLNNSNNIHIIVKKNNLESDELHTSALQTCINPKNIDIESGKKIKINGTRKDKLSSKTKTELEIQYIPNKKKPKPKKIPLRKNIITILLLELKVWSLIKNKKPIIGMVKNGILNGSKHNARLTPRIKLMKKR